MIMPQQIMTNKWVELIDGRTMFINDVDRLGKNNPTGHFALYLVPKQGDTDGEWVSTEKIKRMVGKNPYHNPPVHDLGVASWSNTTKQMNEMTKLVEFIDHLERMTLVNFIKQAHASGWDIKKIEATLEKHGLKPEEVEELIQQSINELSVHESLSLSKLVNEASKSIEKNVEKADVDQAQLKRGIEIEYEHTDDWKLAEKIALDHLAEIPDYYTRLDNMEKTADKEGMKNETDYSNPKNKEKFAFAKLPPQEKERISKEMQATIADMQTFMKNLKTGKDNKELLDKYLKQAKIKEMKTFKQLIKELSYNTKECHHCGRKIENYRCVGCQKYPEQCTCKPLEDKDKKDENS